MDRAGAFRAGGADARCQATMARPHAIGTSTAKAVSARRRVNVDAAGVAVLVAAPTAPNTSASGWSPAITASSGDAVPGSLRTTASKRYPRRNTVRT